TRTRSMRIALAVIALAIGLVPNITHAEPAAQKCRRIAELVAGAMHGRVASQLEQAIAMGRRWVLRRIRGHRPHPRSARTIRAAWSGSTRNQGGRASDPCFHSKG